MRPGCVHEGVTRTRSEQEWAEEYLGRLWILPGVSLRPVDRPIAELWRTAPGWLRRRASRPFTEAQREVWRVVRDPQRLGTEALPNVPFWIEEERVGYVLDFLLPEYGVNVQIDAWHPSYEEEELPAFDPVADPDHPYNEERTAVLGACGIEELRYWDGFVREFGADEVCAEIRRELGFGRPPWLSRTSFGLSEEGPW